MIEVATRDDNEENANAQDDNANNLLNPNNNGQVIIIQGGQRIIRRGNAIFRVPALPQPGVVDVPTGAEQIWKVGIVSDRIIVATTNGRIIALDMADGKTIWQMRPSDRPVDRLLVSDDFVVGQVNDGSQIRVIAPILIPARRSCTEKCPPTARAWSICAGPGRQAGLPAAGSIGMQGSV